MTREQWLLEVKRNIKSPKAMLKMKKKMKKIIKDKKKMDVGRMEEYPETGNEKAMRKAAKKAAGGNITGSRLVSIMSKRGSK